MYIGILTSVAREEHLIPQLESSDIWKIAATRSNTCYEVTIGVLQLNQLHCSYQRTTLANTDENDEDRAKIDSRKIASKKWREATMRNCL
jgi:hypothetical protein